MAVKEFPSELYVKSLDTSEESEMGKFNITNTTEIRALNVSVYINGTLSGTEQMRVNIYNTNDTLLMSSAWMDLSNITNISEYWLGRFQFDFTRKYLEANSDYVFKMEVQNYTRNADTFYLGYVLDWPITTNTQLSTPPLGADVEIIGYE